MELRRPPNGGLLLRRRLQPVQEVDGALSAWSPRLFA